MVIEVTQEEYDRKIASGADPENTLTPGRHVFVRGGFMKRHGLTQEDMKEMLKPKNTKVGVYIKLDLDVLDFFKDRADGPGESRYQTQINAELRKAMEAAQAHQADPVKNLQQARSLIETAIRQVQRKRSKRVRRLA